MCQRLKAAPAARINPDFFVIARTDGASPLGFGEAFRRAHTFHEAGAGTTFITVPPLS